MSRQVKISTRELGELNLLLVYSKDGTWEEEWYPIQGTSFADIVTTVSKETMDHALHGYTSPLVKQLGIAPENCARKLPLISQVCRNRLTCKLYDLRQCVPTHPKMPWCYEPDGLKTDDSVEVAANAIRYWRDKTYIIVVEG